MEPHSKKYTITLDDDPTVAKIVTHMTGIPSLPFRTIDSLLHRAASYRPLAAFIDVQLEEQNGIDAIPDLRRFWPFTALIVITAGSREDVVGKALASGANDFMKKGFGADELNARLHARIAEMNLIRAQNSFVYGNTEFSRLSGELFSEGQRVTLTTMESRVFYHLISNKGMTIGRDELLRRVWTNTTVSSNALDRKLSGIRKALRAINSNLECQCVYGQGVILMERHRNS